MIKSELRQILFNLFLFKVVNVDQHSVKLCARVGKRATQASQSVQNQVNSHFSCNLIYHTSSKQTTGSLITKGHGRQDKQQNLIMDQNKSKTVSVINHINIEHQTCALQHKRHCSDKWKKTKNEYHSMFFFFCIHLQMLLYSLYFVPLLMVILITYIFLDLYSLWY